MSKLVKLSPATLMWLAGVMLAQAAYGVVDDASIFDKYFDWKKPEVARQFDYGSLDHSDLKYFQEAIDARVAATVAMRNSWLGRAAEKDIYSDWWCYEDQTLLNTRVGMELVKDGGTYAERQAMWTRLEAIVQDFKARAPKPAQKETPISIQEAANLIPAYLELDQYWNRIVFDEFQVVKESLGSHLGAIEALRQLVASQQCMVYDEAAKFVVALASDNGWKSVGALDSDTLNQLAILIQHADYHVDLQSAALPHIKAWATAGKLRATKFMLLHDRFGLNMNHKQHFGTQVRCTPEGYQPKPLDAPDRIKEIRAEAGLEPLEDYLKSVPGCGNKFSF